MWGSSCLGNKNDLNPGTLVCGTDCCDMLWKIDNLIVRPSELMFGSAKCGKLHNIIRAIQKTEYFVYQWTCNVWHNMFSHICCNIECHFKRSVDILMGIKPFHVAALASRCLQLVVHYMPMVRQHFEGKLLNKHVNMLKHFDQISKVCCDLCVCTICNYYYLRFDCCWMVGCGALLFKM